MGLCTWAWASGDICRATVAGGVWTRQDFGLSKMNEESKQEGLTDGSSVTNSLQLVCRIVLMLCVEVSSLSKFSNPHLQGFIHEHSWRVLSGIGCGC
jgi:hypothetical protein